MSVTLDQELINTLKNLPPDQRALVFSRFSERECLEIIYDWEGIWARPNQREPPGDWRTWLLLAGRGFGKTRTIVEWVRKLVETGRAGRIALVGRTAPDIRDVLIDGESGILATARPDFRPVWQPSKRRLVWPNGAIATTFSADVPDQLRGPQHDAAVADELAAWEDPDSWDQLQFGLRLGKSPRVAVATTPRPTAIIKALVKDPSTVVTTGSTFDNAANLAPQFLQKVIQTYGGTRLGRQELLGKILDDNPGALWHSPMFDERRSAPELKKVVVAVDPAASNNEHSDETGIIVVGLGIDNLYYVLADFSIQGSVEEWTRRAYYAYQEYDADCIVVEVNNGGNMVAASLRNISPDIVIREVRASRGKVIRAEPVAMLYEQHRVFHVRPFPDLENQLCDWDPITSKESPDRLDALVWGISYLAAQVERRIRAA